MKSNPLEARYSYFRSEPSFEFLQTSLQGFVDAFGIDWLSAGEENVLQKLWQRRDPIATLELATLGSAIGMLTKHRRWLCQTLKKVRSENPGNARGALFEILALAQFSICSGNLTPAKESQPGFDATFTFEAGGSVTVSLKHYTISPMHADFLRNAEQARSALRDGLWAHRTPGLRMHVESSTFPNPSEWKTLVDFLRTVHGPPPSPKSSHTLGDYWKLWAQSLELDFTDLVDGLASHVLLITGPFHQNEEVNFRSRLGGGVQEPGTTRPFSWSTSRQSHLHPSTRHGIFQSLLQLG